MPTTTRHFLPYYVIMTLLSGSMMGAAQAQAPTASWVKELKGPMDQYVNDIAIDQASGSAYVVGNTQATMSSLSLGPAAGAEDAFVAKYDRSGDPVWAFSLAGSGPDLLSKVEVDQATGNVIVAGSSSSPVLDLQGMVGSPAIVFNSSEANVVLACYSPDGALLWYQHLMLYNNDPDQARGLAVDATGISLLLNSQGNGKLPGSALSNTNPSGLPDGTWNLVLARFSLSGTLQWQLYGGTPGEDHGNGLGSDGTNTYVSYVAGTTAVEWWNSTTQVQAYTTPFAKQVCISAFSNATGSPIWTQHIQSSTESPDRNGDLAVGCGALYITGSIMPGAVLPGGVSTTNTSTGRNFFLARLDPNDGLTSWVRNGGSADSAKASTGKAVTVTPLGDIVIAGDHRGPISFSGNVTTVTGNTSSGHFLASYRPGGAMKWALGVSNTSGTTAEALAMDLEGGIHLGGNALSSVTFPPLPATTHSGGSDGFLVRFQEGTRRYIQSAPAVFDAPSSVCRNSGAVSLSGWKIPQTSGNVLDVITHMNVSSNSKIEGALDSDGCKMDSGPASITLELTDTVPQGEALNIRWKRTGIPGAPAVLNIFVSPDGSNWTAVSPSISTQRTNFITTRITAPIAHLFVRLERPSGSGDLEVDGIVFNSGTETNGIWSGPGVSSGTWTPLSLTSPTPVTYSVGSGSCQSSSTASIQIIDGPIAGTTTGPPPGTAHCPGSNSGTITLSGNSGPVIAWESSSDNFTTAQSNPCNASDTTFANLTATTSFRALVGNSCGTATSSITTITVLDTVPPTITCPGSITINLAPGQCDTAAFFAATATDDCGTFGLSYSIPSGSTFGPGSSTVYAYATDASANVGSCSFQVNILPPPSAFLTYSAATYCQGTGTVLPSSFGPMVPNSYFTGPAGCVINASTGEIDLSNSLPGNHSVGYVIQGTCPYSAWATVTILPPPDAGQDSTVLLCSLGVPQALQPFLAGTPDAGGTWTDPLNAPHTGTFIPGIDVPGAYTYTVAGTAPCTSHWASVTVGVDPVQTWYADTDSDGAGDPMSVLLSCSQPAGFVSNNTDLCPTDPNKTAPGTCGCGTLDIDTDNDGVADCIDSCPGIAGQIGSLCNDGDPNTGNDVIGPGCVCAGQLIDCNGIAGGSAYLDNCATCVGGNTGLTACVADCNGDFGGSAYLDNCATCVGGNTGLTACVADCNGDFGGSAYLDNCATCVGGNTGLTACVADCNGDFGGSAYLDNCATCVGGNTGLTACVADCNGDWGGTAWAGSPCDDNDPSTINDQFDASCNCAGTIPCLAATISSLQGNSPVCVNDALNLSSSVTGTAPITYQWTGPGGIVPNSNQPTLTVQAPIAGTYRVLVTNACGTDSMETIVQTVAMGDASWNAPSSLCSTSGTVDLVALVTGDPGGTWSGPNVVGAVFDPSGLNGSVGISYVVGTGSCQVTNEQFITVEEGPSASAGPDDEVCGTSYQLQAILAQAVGSWSGGPVGTSFFPNASAPNASVSVPAPGSYVFEWTVGNGQCWSSDQVTITFHNDDSSGIHVFAGDDQEIEIDPAATLNGTSNAAENLWSVVQGSGIFEDQAAPATVVTGLSIGANRFVLKGSNGPCAFLTDTVEIVLRDLFIPQGISPNGDGVNDEFVITGLSAYPENSLQVFDRWGREIYTGAPYTNDWHGQGNTAAELPPDTYFYVLNLGQERTYNGYIILKR